MPEGSNIKAYYNGLQQISSGSIIFGPNDDIKFEIESEVFVSFVFRNDTKENKNSIKREINKNTLTLTLYNFDSLGTSFIGPVEVGRIGNRSYLICFTVFNIGDSNSAIKTLLFNWYKKEADNE